MIRKATEADASRLAEIQIYAKRSSYRSIFQNDKVSFNEMQVLKLALFYQDYAGSIDNIYVFDDGIVKGMMKWNCENPEAWELKELYVDPFFQREGIGASLIDNFIAAAKCQNVDETILWVLEENTCAVRFYESQGYVKTGERKEFSTTGKYLLKYKKDLKSELLKLNYKYINMETYKRKSHFKYFNSLVYPYVGVTVNVDITALLEFIRVKNLPFFLTICYCVSRAANQVSEFRQRIIENQIIEYDYCLTSHTVALSDGTYCYCDLDSNLSFEDYISYATEEQEKAKQRNSIQEEADDILGKIFISTIPWISYTALINPTPIPADSNPRITWGKYFMQNEKVLLPVSVLCHHALVDGLHISKFYDFLEKEIAVIAQGIRS